MDTQVDVTAAYGRAVAQASRIIDGIRPDQLDAQTPCKLWNSRELLNHFVGSCLMMSAAGSGKAVAQGMSGSDAVAAMGDVLGDDPSAAYRKASADAVRVFTAPGALEKTWALPFGELPGAVALNIHLMETILHSWDLAKASGQLDALDPELAEVGSTVAAGLIVPEFRNEAGDPFAAEVEVTSSASPYERFAGFTGRQP